MGLWFGDYVQLKSEIDYFNFSLKRLARTEEEKLRTSEEIRVREQQAKQFLSIADALDGIERTIFLKKYVEGKKQREIAEELNLSRNYIRSKVTEINNKIQFVSKLLEERDEEIE